MNDRYHTYPAHAAFGGYEASGIRLENHRVNMLVIYSSKAVGLS